MKQIRREVFETNSSSTHSITICTAEEYEKFQDGEMMFDFWNGKLVPMKEIKEDEGYFTSYDDFGGDMETYEKFFTTPSGDKMVAFGYYGYDG